MNKTLFIKLLGPDQYDKLSGLNPCPDSLNVMTQFLELIPQNRKFSGNVAIKVMSDNSLKLDVRNDSSHLCIMFFPEDIWYGIPKIMSDIPITNFKMGKLIDLITKEGYLIDR